MLIHIHPSGDARPSEEDIAVTRKLDQIGRALDVEIFDHIVVTSASTHHIANRDCVSGRSTKDMSFTMRSSEHGPPQVRDDLDNAPATMRRVNFRRHLIVAEELFGETAWEMSSEPFNT